MRAHTRAKRWPREAMTSWAVFSTAQTAVLGLQQSSFENRLDAGQKLDSFSRNDLSLREALEVDP